MKGNLSIKELESYKKADLQELAKSLGVSSEGTVKELAARCAAVEVDVPEESQLTEEEKEAAKAAEEQKAKEEAEKAAGKVKVEVVERYIDKQFNQIKEVGEVFAVDKDRAKQLVAAQTVKIKE